MRKERLLAETQRLKILENSGVNTLQGQNLISVDVQEAYAAYMGFDARSYGQMINSSFESLHSLTFLFNGPDLGFPSEEEYRWWLIEECGIEEQITASAYFYDKGYAFFRYCMDEGIDDEDIVALVKFMMANDVNDTRDMDAEMWEKFVLGSDVDRNEVRDLMENVDDMLNIPELMEFLQRYSGKLMVCGGGINECLKEVEIALMALDKPYNVLTQWTY